MSDVEDALDDVLDNVAAIDQEVRDSAAEVTDLEIDEDAEVVVELETEAGMSVEIPADADDGIVIEGEQGDSLEIDLPGSPDDAEVASDGSAVYQDAMTDTDLVVQAQDDGGVRMLTVIDGAGAPTAFDFPVDFSGAERLELLADGGAVLLDGAGLPVYFVPAPWAYDADGNEVPSWYTVHGDTLTLHVDHSAVVAYPVVADPWWNPFSWNWGSVWNVLKKGGSVAVRNLNKCLGGAASWVIPTGAGVGIANVASKKISGRLAIRVAGGPWAYVSLGAAGCIADYF